MRGSNSTEVSATILIAYKQIPNHPLDRVRRNRVIDRRHARVGHRLVLSDHLLALFDIGLLGGLWRSRRRRIAQYSAARRADRTLVKLGCRELTTRRANRTMGDGKQAAGCVGKPERDGRRIRRCWRLHSRLGEEVLARAAFLVALAASFGHGYALVCGTRPRDSRRSALAASSPSFHVS